MLHLKECALAGIISVTASGSLAADFTVERAIQFASSPEEAWNVVGDFCDVDDWHPLVNSCTLKVIDGSLHRILVLADGAEFVEKRIAVEPGLSYTYKTVSSPLPLEKYTATVSITIGAKSTVTWSGRFSSQDPEMEKAVAEFYETGLTEIEARLKN